MIYYSRFLLSVVSFKRVIWWCASSSSCAGQRIVMFLTPRRPSLICWPMFKSGKENVVMAAPWSTACELHTCTQRLCCEYNIYFSIVVEIATQQFLNKYQLQKHTVMVIKHQTEIPSTATHAVKVLTYAYKQMSLGRKSCFCLQACAALQPLPRKAHHSELSHSIISC